MKTICIYHKNCFDGICAAWVVSRYYSNAEFIPMAYSDSLEWLIQGWNQGTYSQEDNLIVVDFSFKRGIMESLKKLFPKMLVLDHHKTAQVECKGLNYCIFDMNESGASLAWKHYSHVELPILVRYIKDRDLWLFNEKNSEDINSFIQSYPMTIENYEHLNNILIGEDSLTDALFGGQSINRYKKTMVEAMCKNAAYCNNYPFYNDQVPIVNASLLFSEVGNELCKLYPSAPFAAYYFDRLRDGVRQWGLRSIGNFDVSEVAKTFGGGGHKNAAGFEQKLNEL